MKHKILSVFFCLSFCLFNSCRQSSTAPEEDTSFGTKNIRVVTWNVQEFFDGVRDGCEYAEYRKKKDWTQEMYQTRLERLCAVLKTLKGDIIVLEEIENANVLRDISNFTCDSSWKKEDLWSYGTFSKESDDSAIGCAVLSRFPIISTRTHSTDIRLYDEEQPSKRPIMEVTVDLNGTPLTVFANHWKSKSGGKEETEIWRDWQESTLASILQTRLSFDPDFSAILCGDFNRDISDFNVSYAENGARGNVQLRYGGFSKTGTVSVFSPWLKNNLCIKKGIGSYRFKDRWERIDHIFTFGNVEILNFYPAEEGFWTTDEGFPYPYNLYSGQGYSDHLPLVASLLISSKTSSD